MIDSSAAVGNWLLYSTAMERSGMAMIFWGGNFSTESLSTELFFERGGDGD